MQTIDLVKKIVEALEDKKAEDITVLDIGEVSSIADYFIIANEIMQISSQPWRMPWMRLCIQTECIRSR